MDISFEYCALRYLLQWEQKEKPLYKRMRKTPAIEDVRDSLTYFQVARNFAGLKDDRQAGLVSELLDSVDAHDDWSSEQKVARLASEFRSKFGQLNLSAASKLLWLKHRRPYILYDKRAVKALRAMGSTFETKNYSQYCVAWRERYRQNEKRIQKASSRLVKIHSFFPAGQHDKVSLSKLVGQPWFLERVFDKSLWELGGGR